MLFINRTAFLDYHVKLWKCGKCTNRSKIFLRITKSYGSL